MLPLVRMPTLAGTESVHVSLECSDFRPAAAWAHLPGIAHALPIYESDDFLIGTLSGFFSAGLAAGESALVIATEPHRHALAHGIVVRANRAALDLLGYRATHDDILGRLKAGETLRDYEARLRCKDGSIKEVLIDSNVLWEDGRFVHTRCSTRDVTPLKRAQAAPEQALARRGIANRAEDAIVVASHGGGCVAEPTLTVPIVPTPDAPRDG